MKKSVTEILNGCQPQELDGVLGNIDAELPEEVSADHLKDLAVKKAGITPRRHTARRIALIAACITLIAGVLVGCYVAEQNEYNNAVKFFDLNALDTADMSREDIKRVYRDMTTESFTHDESAELLMQTDHEINRINRNTDRVGGYEINILNNNANNADIEQIAELNVGLPLFVGYGDVPDNTKYFLGDEFEKVISGELGWYTRLPHYCDKYYIAGDRALVWGSYIYDTVHDYMHTSVALIDDKDGAILWEKTLDSSYHFDESAIAAIADDGRIAVLTIATDDRFSDERYLVFRELNSKGEIVKERKQRKDDVVFSDHLTPLSDGWLAEYQLSALPAGEGAALNTMLVKLDENGVIRNQWSFSEDDKDGFRYEIADIKEHEGKIYLSAQARPNESEMYEDLDYENITVDSDFSNFSDELRDAARKEFSSVLFVFDPASNKPEEFTSVGGTMAGDLRTDEDGSLVWRVGRIVKCGWAPWASSFQFYGLTRQYEYTFHSDNKLKEEKTDIFNSFRTI